MTIWHVVNTVYVCVMRRRLRASETKLHNGDKRYAAAADLLREFNLCLPLESFSLKPAKSF